jgi:hypothetical protein
MSDKPLVDLVMVAANLKTASPQLFAQLVDAVRSFEKQAITEMVAGEQPHEVFRAQGKVKTIQQLRRHLQQCSELRDTYQRRDQNARSS